MARKKSDEETLGHGAENSPAMVDGGEKREKNHQESGTVGFWHKDLRHVRGEVFKHWGITTLILSTFILAILSLYWAVLFRVEQNLSALVVYVVDFDGQVAPYTDITPVVGPAIVSAAEAMIAPSGSLGWGSLPASTFNFDLMEVRQAIYDEKAWAAVIINANATALLQDTVTNGNASYDPMGAAQIIYVEARDETTIGNYLTPGLQQFQSMVAEQFGKMWTQQTLQRASATPSVLANIQGAPQAISPAIGFSTFNLQPFFPPVVTPAITIVFLSLFYSLISLAFQIPFSSPSAPDTVVANPTTAYSHGSFVVFWMINFIGMVALGLACENVAQVVGQPWTGFWLIFWVITNVATSFYSITLAPRFDYWGYAWPLHNIVNASRTILFDTHSRIGLNFGILFAWSAVNTVLFPLTCYFMRWKTMREKKKQAESKTR